LDRVDPVVPRQREAAYVPSTGRWTRPDRLSWSAGDAAQCDLWFPPKRIRSEDGTTKLLPVLVITAAHSRFTTAG
jgi:hypothetical protein